MIKWLYFFGIILVLSACAKQGAPTGGLKDIAPPKFLKSNPDTLQKNVPLNQKTIRIDFDEYIVLKDAQKQIIVSPPMKTLPVILPTENSPRKYILITFKDSLQPNTTYNINFGNSVQDNTEGNKLSNFAYIFSTGKNIDSLQISGKITRALSDDVNLKTLIALYKKDTTEVDLNKKPYYITKVDSAGNYQLKYLSKGQYQIIAFSDENYNTKYDSKTEEFGFGSEFINLEKNTTNNIILSKQNEAYKAVSIKQEGTGKLTLATQGKPTKLNIKPLHTGFPDKYYITHTPRTDSLYIWFNPKEAKFEDKNQRLKFIVENGSKKDTLSTFYNSNSANSELKNDKKNKSEPRISILNEAKEMVPNEFLTFKFNDYIVSVDESKIKVTQEKENLKITTNLSKDNPTKIDIKFPIDFEKKYKVDILPNAFYNHLGQTNDSLSYSFTTKGSNEYGNLKLKLNNLPKKPIIFQLMSKDKVVREFYGVKDVLEINYLLPGDYSYRILVDENENGYWDAVNFKTKTQAEKTYSSPNIVTIRAFWDINDSWTLSD